MKEMPESDGQKAGQARAYLLGRLPAEARDQMDDEYFTDRETFEEMLAAENDLVDEYVRGQLSGSDRKAFEREYLNTPEGRQKVALARTLVQYVDASAPLAVRRQPFWMRPVWVVCFTCVLLTVAAGIWWNAGRPGPRQDAAVQPPAVSSGATAVLVLTPGLLRDETGSRTLVIPAGASQVELRAHLELQGYSTFDAVVKTPEGIAIWSGQGLRVGPGQVLSIGIPGSRLAAGDYVLSVSSGAVDAGEFFFRVSRK
jgi:hypothetical protein